MIRDRLAFANHFNYVHKLPYLLFNHDYQHIMKRVNLSTILKSIRIDRMKQMCAGVVCVSKPYDEPDYRDSADAVTDE